MCVGGCVWDLGEGLTSVETLSKALMLIEKGSNARGCVTYQEEPRIE